ncbi:MAG: DUF4041 domain-containing protein [Acidimicrobiia bacterium]|nr:DUF4041 domain-containing protein [Acidimicrobiia bacterium]
MAAAAGWYADPSGRGGWRWWDGQRWTEHVRPAAEAAGPTGATPPRVPQAPDTTASASGTSQQAWGLSPTADLAPRPAGQAALDRPGAPANALAHGGSEESLGSRLAGLLDGRKGGLLGGRRILEEENAELKAQLAALGPGDIAALSRERDALRAAVNRERDQLRAELVELRAERDCLSAKVVETSETAMLQEVGIYRYAHPLDSAVAYKAQLATLNDAIRGTAKSRAAVQGSTNWQVNGSAKEGARMVTDFSKLMLRAYNNEADNLVRSLKPYAVERAIERLDRTKATISKLGRTMSIEVTEYYHQLRTHELRLTADFRAKEAEEKEREREARARLRDEEQARREFEREQARLERERAHYANALAALRQGTGDSSKIDELQAKLAEVTGELEAVEARAANHRAGYVYVISNVGAFGPDTVKIGLTRRLVPQDRVRELGDASVPFTFDTHALIFSEDAVALEATLHRALESRRVNRVNLRREFFRATPAEVRDILGELEGNALLSYVDEPVALEWHQSQNEARAQAAA